MTFIDKWNTALREFIKTTMIRCHFAAPKITQLNTCTWCRQQPTSYERTCIDTWSTRSCEHGCLWRKRTRSSGKTRGPKSDILLFQLLFDYWEAIMSFLTPHYSNQFSSYNRDLLMLCHIWRYAFAQGIELTSSISRPLLLPTELSIVFPFYCKYCPDTVNV